MAITNKSAVNEVSEYGKQQVAKFNKIAGAVNKVAAESRFRKAISVLNHRTPFIEATIQLPAFQTGEGNDPQNFNWDMFELPYNNLESLELKTEGGTMAVDLKFSDNSFVFARNLILKLQAIAASGDFGGTPIIRLRWGWSESGLNKTPKNQPQPIIQNVLFFYVNKVTADSDITKETYTLSGSSLESPQGIHAGMWKPFNYFGPQPLLDFAWSDFYETLKKLKEALKSTGESEFTNYDKKLKEAVNNKKEDALLNGKKNQALSSFVIKLKKVYGVENLESIRKILSGVNAIDNIKIESTNKAIDNGNINTADFKIISDANKTQDQSDLFVKVNNSSPKKMIDIISKGIQNRDLRGMVDQLFPVIGELHVNAYDALCHCIAGMLEQNSQINKISTKGKNKILFLNFIPTNIIEDIKKK